jgi:molybdate transport system substrate-binding protein
VRRPKQAISKTTGDTSANGNENHPKKSKHSQAWQDTRMGSLCFCVAMRKINDQHGCISICMLKLTKDWETVMYEGFHQFRYCLFALLFLIPACATVQAEEIKVFSVNGVKDVLMKLGADFETVTGNHVQLTFGTIGQLNERMKAGDMPDVLVAISPAMVKAEEQGTIAAGGSIEVGRTGMGVAVKAGTAAPDLSTSQSFRDALLKAKSLAYSDPKTGAASGVAFAKILTRMGLADQVKDKTTLVGGGSVGELVAQGKVELGIQQITELLPVKGITLVGPLPAEWQSVTVYQAGVLRQTAKAKDAASFVRFISSPEEARKFTDAGFGRY